MKMIAFILFYRCFFFSFLFKERELKKTVEALAQMKDAKMEIGLPPKASSLKYRDVNVGKHLLDSDEEDICYLPAHADDYDDDEEEFYGG